MAGCTSRRTSRLGGGAWPSRIARLRDRIAPQSCQPGGAQSCPRRRTPQRTPQPAHARRTPRPGPRGPARRAPRRPPRWSTWTRNYIGAKSAVRGRTKPTEQRSVCATCEQVEVKVTRRQRGFDIRRSGASTPKRARSLQMAKLLKSDLETTRERYRFTLYFTARIARIRLWA